MISYSADAVLGLAVTGCVYLVISVISLVRYRRNRPPLPVRPEPVTVLKPLHGDEPRLCDCLRSFCLQDYPGSVQIVLGVQNPNDSALGVAAQLAKRFPDRVQVAVEPRMHGVNRKVSNLIGMLKHARYDTIVLADSDIKVEPDYLLRLVGELQVPGTGAVTCLYHGVPAAGLWSRICGTTIDSFFLPNAVTGLALGLARPCFGSTIAMRRDTLAAIGGFEAFANHLADDYAIGAAVRALGLQVAVPAFTVGHLCKEASLRSLWRQELRWARTVRIVDPAGYSGSIVTYAFPLALLGAMLGDMRGIWIAAVALSGRYVLCRTAEGRFGLPKNGIWILPLCEVFSFAIFAWSFFGSSVHWHGVEHRVDREGILQAGEVTQ